MNERTVSFLLHEIKYLRILCRRCGAAVEVPLINASDALAPGGRCRFCDAEIQSCWCPNQPALAALAEAANALSELEEGVELRLVFPDE